MRPKKRLLLTVSALKWRSVPRQSGTLGREFASGLPDSLCAPRCPGIRAQRNCGDHGLLRGKLEIAIAQSADPIAGFVAGRIAGPGAPGTSGRENADRERRLSYNERTKGCVIP